MRSRFMRSTASPITPFLERKKSLSDCSFPLPPLPARGIDEQRDATPCRYPSRSGERVQDLYIPESMTSPLWAPSPARAAATRLRAFARTAGGGRDYASLHRWSIERPEEFWSAVWDFCGVVGDRPGPVAVGLERMGPPTPRGPRWFPEAHLNFAENLLRPGGDGPAIIA